MSLRDDILARLTADEALMGLLEGGIHAQGEISRQLTPAAFDAYNEIRPCALLRSEAETPVGPFDRSSRAFVVLYFYQRAGFDVIDPALQRVYDLLQKQKIGASTWEIRHADDVRDQRDQGLNCSLSYSRYAVVRLR